MTVVEPELEDEALEARLRAYRPVGPPQHLREGVLALAPGRSPARTPGWLTLAALLVLGITLRWSARSDVATAAAGTPGALLLVPSTIAAGIDPRVAGILLRAVDERSRAESRGAWMDPRIMGVER